MNINRNPLGETLSTALDLMSEALRIMDKDRSVGTIAANLELARSRLAEHLGIIEVLIDDEFA